MYRASGLVVMNAIVYIIAYGCNVWLFVGLYVGAEREWHVCLDISPYLPVLFETGSLEAEWATLAGLQAYGDSPVFPSHLSTSVQVEITSACTMMSGFDVGSGNANSRFQACEASVISHWELSLVTESQFCEMWAVL